LKNSSHHAGAQVQALLNASTFDFFFNLVVLDGVFSITKILLKYLQYVNISISAACYKVNAISNFKGIKDRFRV